MTQHPGRAGLGWAGIARLGLVQMALGAIVVLTTSTLNRVMVVELALPAMLPGALVALHYAVQITRPRWGHGSDAGGRRTPWILGGMTALAAGGVLAAVATVVMGASPLAGTALAVLAFIIIGGGVGAAGTSLLVLLATRTAPSRRAPAAMIVWLMMIASFAITATVAGGFLDPYTPGRLVAVTAGVSVFALIVAWLAVSGVERTAAPVLHTEPQAKAPKVPFRQALAEVWAEASARRFAVFIFVAMLAYSAQDLILEPFAGTVFGMTPGESTKLSGTQHGGVFVGMLLVGLLGSGRVPGFRHGGNLRAWVFGGCLASAAALAGLVIAGFVGPGWPLKATVFALGLANGAFAVAAIGSMMGLAAEGTPGREGVRMGVWGAAQAIAFALGGFLGTAGIDLTRALFDSPVPAYALIFGAEGALFVVAAILALKVEHRNFHGGIHGDSQGVAAARAPSPALAAAE